MGTFGNIQREQSNNSNTIIQPALEIGKEDDEYEKEADSVADKVMRKSDEEEENIGESTPMVQMKEEDEEKKGESTPMIQMKEEDEEKKGESAPMVQMKEEDEEETPTIQKKTDSSNGGITASANIEKGINSTKGNGQSLPKDIQHEMGNKIGADFSGVKIHTDEHASQMNKEIGAKAFTHGSDIYFNKEQYNPTSNTGKHLLAHELTHTVQQGKSVNRKIQRAIYLTQKSDDPNLPTDFWGTASGKMDLMSDDQVAKLKGLLDEAGDNPFKLAFSNIITAKNVDGTTAEYSIISGKDEGFTDAKLFRISLLKDIISNLQAVKTPMMYNDAADLIVEVKKRFLIAMDMRTTQGISSGNKPTGYPKLKKSEILPRVNEAAKKYWDVRVNADTPSIIQGKTNISDYWFELNAEGKKNAYQALTYMLFIHQTDSSLRTLMHCDYMISAIQYKVMADTMGIEAFNKKVKDGEIVIVLRAESYKDLISNDVAQKTTSDGKSLAMVGTPPIDFNAVNASERNTESENEFIIGDHVIFYNHEAYDELNANRLESWRLENAIVTGGSPGNHKFQGHGYFSPRVRKEFVTAMVEKFNFLVKIAESHTKVTDTKTRDKLLDKDFTHNLTGSPFKVIRYEDGKWKIYYHKGGKFSGNMASAEVLSMDLREVTEADYPFPFIKPGENFIRITRPIESR